MVSWFDSKFIIPFPIVYLFILVPGLFPDFHFEMSDIVITWSSTYRHFFVNSLVYPVLSVIGGWSYIYEWYMGSGFREEVIFHVLITLNLFVVLAIPLILIFEMQIRLNNWFVVKQYETQEKYL